METEHNSVGESLDSPHSPPLCAVSRALLLSKLSESLEDLCQLLSFLEISCVSVLSPQLNCIQSLRPETVFYVSSDTLLSISTPST